MQRGQFIVQETDTKHIYIYIYIYIYKQYFICRKYCYMFRCINKPTHRKHQNRDYTYATVQTVHRVTKLTTATYCNYDSWHSSQRFIDCILSSTVTITYANISIHWFFFSLTFRHRASCIQEGAFCYFPENAFYIFNQQIYFIIWHLRDRASLI